MQEFVSFRFSKRNRGVVICFSQVPIKEAVGGRFIVRA